MRSFPARPLAVGECVDSVALPGVAEAGGVSGVSRRREAVVRPEWTLNGARLRDALEQASWGFVGGSVWGEPAPAPLENPVVQNGVWTDAQWRERAFHTLLGASPGQARWFPLGLVPLLVSPEADPRGYLAVRVVPDGAGVRWSELRRVDLPEASQRATEASPDLGPNLLSAAVPWTREELSAELMRVAKRKGTALPTGVPGVPRVSTARAPEPAWMRAWDGEGHRLRGTPPWQQYQRDAFDVECAAADPLRLGVGDELVDRHSYEGCRMDLEEAVPFSAVVEGGTSLLRDYFEQVWGYEPDAAGLRQVTQRLELVPRQRESGEGAPVRADDASRAGRGSWAGRLRRRLSWPGRRAGQN